MNSLLSNLTYSDYAFLVGTIESPWNMTDDGALTRHLQAFAEYESDENRARLNTEVLEALRYLGSSDLAFTVRRMAGAEPGVTMRQVIADVSRSLDIRLDLGSSEEEMLVDLVEQYAEAEFSRMSAVEQQATLEELGVDHKEAARFVARSAGVFAMPVMIQAFNTIVVDGLIRRVIFGTIAKYVGKEVARKILLLLAGRIPWWVKWLGPATWALSITWTAVDLQGPAMRKTIPIVLYLGLCARRIQTASEHAGEADQESIG